MNMHSACAMLVATLGTALALASSTAVAAKPGSGGSTDPCIDAQARGFPSFAFTKQVGTTWGIFVADATAQCQRQVGSYPYSRTVNFRYDPATHTGVLFHDADGSKLVAAAISAAFSATGSPTVQANAFGTLISVADLPDPEQAAWGPLKYIGSPVVSPNGDAILFAGSSAAGGDGYIFWVCSLNIDAASATVTVDPSTCSVVHRAPSTGMGATATWGARPGTIYVTQTAISGSGGSLYRLTMPTPDSPTIATYSPACSCSESSRRTLRLLNGRKTINFEHVQYSTSAFNAPFDHVLKLPHDHIRSNLDANEGAAGRFGE